MRRLVIILGAWSVFSLVLFGVGLVISEGEPICEGPLILGAGDSEPPSCEDPIDAWPTAVQQWAISTVALGVVVTVIGLRPRADAAAPTG